MKALVTGAAGFIGSHLVEQLLKEPDVEEVKAVDNFSTGSRRNIEPFLSRIDFIEGDLLEDDVRDRAVAGVDVIFHEAAIPSVSRSVEQPIMAHANGVHATLLLLESARQGGARRFVLAGSSSAYGDTPQLPKCESMAANPLSPYAATKAACELYLRAYARCYELDTVTLRYFNVFGPRQDPTSPYSGVMARFCRAVARREPLMIYGDGEQSRDFTYVANVVHANLLAARHPQRLGGEVFNVGAGKRTSLNQLVGLLREITGHESHVEYQPRRAGDICHSLADISRAGAVLGYRPVVSFKEGLLRTLSWYAAGEEAEEAATRVTSARFGNLPGGECHVATR
jgi:UDP-glucose 4-epimerase